MRHQQLIVPQHPLPTEPQTTHAIPESWQVLGVHSCTSHTLFTQLSHAGQADPQETVHQHLLSIVPQVNDDGHSVRGSHPDCSHCQLQLQVSSPSQTQQLISGKVLSQLFGIVQHSLFSAQASG